jgi:hypothetical protein
MATKHVIEYGPGGYDPSKPNNNIVNEYDVQVPVTATNRETIMTRAAQALTANATFLAIANPTNAQVAAQVTKLTRECNGLIRILLDQLQDVSDT